MLIKLYNAEDFLEVDTNLPSEEIDTLVKLEKVKLEDTLEISLTDIDGDSNGN